MDAASFFQSLINGLSISMGYILIASGFTLLYSIMRLLNFAHGELYMLGAFVTYLIVEYAGLSYFFALPVAMLTIALLGILIERAFFRKFRHKTLYKS